MSTTRSNDRTGPTSGRGTAVATACGMARTALLAGLVATALTWLVTRTPSPASDPGLSCVGSWGEARWRDGGYDHVVHLQSRCRVDAACEVSTDATPESVTAQVKRGEHVEVITVRGAPSATFVPAVVCRPARLH